jgi:hypothetical protein
MLVGYKHLEADMYFERGLNNVYQFDPTKLKSAHEWCRMTTETHMMSGDSVVVSNTFTQDWEMEPYYELAKKYGYRVHSVVVENRHEGVNQHGVPTEKLEQMKKRFTIKL